MKEKYYEHVVDKLFSQTYINFSSSGNRSVCFPFTDIRIHKDSVLNTKSLSDTLLKNFLFNTFNEYVVANYGCQPTDRDTLFTTYIEKVKSNIDSLPIVKHTELQIIID